MSILLYTLAAVVIAIAIVIYIGLKQGDKDRLQKIADHKLPTEQEQWLSFGAILTEYRSEIPQIMKITRGTLEEYREGICEQWNVTDEKSARETIEWLLADGHRHKFSDTFSKVKQGIRPDELEDDEWECCQDTLKLLRKDMNMKSNLIEAVPSMSAWDYERAAFLARSFAFMGFITEVEALVIMKQVGITVQAEFTDWNSYFASFLLGRVIAFDDDSYTMVLNAKELFKPGNIWATYPLAEIPTA